MKLMKKMSKKKIIILVIVIIVLIVIGISIASAAASGGAGYPVVVSKVEKEDIASVIEVSGTVVSEDKKTYFAPVTGLLSSCAVTNGAEVKKGDILLTYDLEDIQFVAKENSLRADAERYGIDATVATINKQQSDYSKAVKSYDEAWAYVVHWSGCLENANREYSEAMYVANEYEALKGEVDAYKIKQAENAVPNEALTQLIAEGEAKLQELSLQMSQYDYKTLESTVRLCSSELNEYKALMEQYKLQKDENPALASQSKQQSVLKEINEMEKENADLNLTKAAEGIIADFNGIVTEVAVLEGQTVTEGMQLFTLQSMDNVKVTVAVTKYDLAQIKQGQVAEVTINGKTYEGVVENISKIAGVNANGAATVDVDVHINNPDDNIILGLEGKVKIQCDTEKDANVLPFSCVNYDTKGAFCYVVEDGVVVRRDVETGLSSNLKIQIISGVLPGDEVISEVTQEIEEGMQVTVMDSEAEKVNAK